MYLKPALLEHDTRLAVDVRQYGIQNTNFPQQCTADQWFDESQFESYRKLGHHTATIAFSALDDVQEMKEYKNALQAKSQGQTPSEEEQGLLEAKLARDRIKAQQFSSRDVLKIFDLLYAQRPT